MLAVAASASGQAFGRFGYADSLDVPGMTLDRSGIQAKWPGAEKFRFLAASKIWRPVLTSPFSQTVVLQGTYQQPAKAVANLFSPALGLYWESGVALKVSSAASPYLTWSEGSVNQEVPTPNVRWLLISFQTSQPPILLVFMDAKVALTIHGKPGDWTIVSDKPYRGWMRIGLPQGLTPCPTQSAAALGKLVQAFHENETIWTDSAPALTKFDVDADLESVTATWTFSKPGAVVPAGATYAALGGYPLKIQSAMRDINAPTDYGDLKVTQESTLRIRFPARRIPTGRCVSVGRPALDPIATVSPIDGPSVVELAFEMLLARRDSGELQLAQSVSKGYFDTVQFVEEPWSRQLLPYGADGSNLDLAAAQALLFQALTTSTQATSEANSLLTSVMWRMDWTTWRLWIPAGGAQVADISRRAAAVAAVASALCPEPERRLEGAMLEAGIAAERGMNLQRVRLGELATSPTLVETLEGVRRTLFSLHVGAPRQGVWLLGQLRTFGSTPIYATASESAASVDFSAATTDPVTITFASGYPVQCEPSVNVAALQVDSSLGVTRISLRAKTPGRCEIVLRIPKWAQRLPDVFEPLRFVEVRR